MFLANVNVSFAYYAVTIVPAKALAQLEGHVHIFGDSRDLVKHVTQAATNTRLGIIIDAASSRLKVNAKYLDIAKQVISDSGATKYACAIVLASRFDLLDALYKRSQALFSKGGGARVAVTLSCGGLLCHDFFETHS